MATTFSVPLCDISHFAHLGFCHHARQSAWHWDARLLDEQDLALSLKPLQQNQSC
jgi:hypothetical protein